MKKKRIFITFEGTDGAGKSTHVKMLRDWLVQRGHRVFVTREPGGGRVSELIRKILLDPRLKMAPLTELLLYEAARAEHVASVIEPKLREGIIVISDRFMDASTAYQGGARGLTFEFVRKLNAIATGRTRPDLTLLLDLPAGVGLSKALARNKSGKGDRLENEGSSFQKKVRKAYLLLARKEKNRIKIIRVQESIGKTQGLIRSSVLRKFAL